MSDAAVPDDARTRATQLRGEIEYQRSFRLTLTGVGRDQEGLNFTSATRQPWVMPGIEEQW